MECVVRTSKNLPSHKNNENTAKQLKQMISELLKLTKTNEQTENCLFKRNDFHISVRQWIFFFSSHHVPRGISVPRPGIESGPLEVRAQSPKHWTARECSWQWILWHLTWGYSIYTLLDQLSGTVVMKSQQPQSWRRLASFRALLEASYSGQYFVQSGSSLEESPFPSFVVTWFDWEFSSAKKALSSRVWYK